MTLRNIVNEVEAAVGEWLSTHMREGDDISWGVGITHEDVDEGWHSDDFLNAYIILNDGELIFETKASLLLADATVENMLKRLQEVWDHMLVNQMASNA